MECGCCQRNQATKWYCHQCIANRLADHNTLRQQLRASLSSAHQRASQLLSPPASDSDSFGVGLERELKAEKFALAVRLRDIRVGLEEGRMEVIREKERLSERRSALTRRRTNLLRAQRLHHSLLDPSSSRSPSPPLRPPDSSLSSLTAQLSSLAERQLILGARIDAAQTILIREVLAVYGFSRSERPLPSPFKSAGGLSLSSSSSSSTSLTMESPTTPNDLPAARQLSYRLSQLPLPPLSLPSLSLIPPALLTASLSHLAHLVRLLALYLDLTLPWEPVLGMFGAGRAGVRRVIGGGAGGGAGDVGGRAGGGGGGGASYPLFPSRKAMLEGSVSSSSSSKRESKERRKKEEAMSRVGGGTAAGQPQTGGIESSSPSTLILRRRSATSTSTSSTSNKAHQEDRLKAVLAGALGLAFDLAYISCQRGRGVGEGEMMRGDLGALLARAAGIGIGATTSDPRRTTTGGGTTTAAMAGTGPGGLMTAIPPPVPFTLDFDLLLTAMTTPPSSLSRAVKEGRMGGLAEGEGESEDEWDLV